MLVRRVELLQQMPIFGGLPEQALQWLLHGAAEVEVASGHWFFRQGDDATHMFVLESGRVSVLREWQGQDVLLRTLARGDCFGEMALLDLFPRSASVRADEACRALTLAPADLHRLFEHDPVPFAMIQMNIAREMSRRLRETDEKLFAATMQAARPPGVGA